MIIADSAKEAGSRSDGRSLEKLQAVVHRYCLSLTGSSWDAEDLAQDTWLKAIGTLGGRGHANPEALLLRIARNKWIDESRRKAVFIKILEREQLPLNRPDNGTLEMEMVFQALNKHLSPLQQTVFLLRDVFRYSIEEAADILQTTKGAVKAALHRARLSLEAVRYDLEKETLPHPDDEGLKAYLHAMVSAYRLGDIATLVELMAQGEIEPAAVTGIVQNRVLQQQSTQNTPTARMTLRMAA
ncbi:RNA polymerase sigma factor [Paenibacillus tarimensis]